MSTIKITQLPLITHLNANTSNTVFVAVDTQAEITGRFTATTLAEGLYENNVLNVGNNSTIILPNVVAQFALRGESYVQTNFTNLSDGGTADYVITANTGTDTTYFVDLGFANKNFIPGSEYNSLGTSIEPMSGYLYVQGNTSGAVGGNLIIGTTSSNTETRFIAGGGTSANVIAKVTPTGLRLVNGKTLTFDDGSVQNTAAATLAYTVAAFTLANTNSNSIVYQTGVDVTQNTTSVAINSYAQSAFALANTNSNSIVYQTGVDVTQNTNIQSAWNKANNALANTSGAVFDGNLNISNNLAVNGTIVLANTNFSTTEAAFRITAAGSSQSTTQAGTLVQLTGKANTPARMLIDSFGASNSSYSIIAGRTARGTVDAPTATQNNDIMLRIAGNSYGTTGYAPFGDARIDFVATENHSDTNRGSRIRFWNTPTGSNVINEIASFNADSVYFTGVVNPQKGFIHTPTIFPSLQTAITIDFANDSVVRAQTATGLVVTLSNLVTGKAVESWITNTSGANQTLTHGISALNSTVNATTYNIPATSSVLVKYWSMDGTLANTFVSIIHA